MARANVVRMQLRDTSRKLATLPDTEAVHTLPCTRLQLTQPSSSAAPHFQKYQLCFIAAVEGFAFRMNANAQSPLPRARVLMGTNENQFDSHDLLYRYTSVKLLNSDECGCECFIWFPVRFACARAPCSIEKLHETGVRAQHIQNQRSNRPQESCQP